MEILNEPIFNTVISSLIAIFVSLITAVLTFHQMEKGQRSFSATLLYNDLKSIEKYLRYERSSVNLRYSDKWQDMVASCSFLTDEQVEKLYSIYDEVYNYNYHYHLREQSVGFVKKEDLQSYKNLQVQIFNTKIENLEKNSDEYEDLIRSLQKQMKK